MFSVASTGFLTGFSLILAIGAQNAFVLRQGLLRQHLLPLCLLVACSDAILIAAGVAGFGSVTAAYPGLPAVMASAGAAFLLFYGATRFDAAWRGDHALILAGKSGNLRAVLGTGFAFTWLNPHVYLDTLGLIGAVSTRYPAPSDKLVFGGSAAAASFVFFFGLGYGARLLAPVMQDPRAWRLFDAGIGVVMWGLALGLVRTALG